MNTRSSLKSAFTTLSLLTCSLFLVACGGSSDEDTSLEHDYPEMNSGSYASNYSMTDFSISTASDYWEIRTGLPSEPEEYSLVRVVDEDTLTALSDVQRDVLNSTASGSGFKIDCQISCFNYLVSVKDDYATVISTYDELKAFFGSIDTEAELYVWLSESDYSLEVEPRSWEATATGFKAIIEWDTHCAHSGTDLVDVSSDGTITLLERLEEKTDGPCY